MINTRADLDALEGTPAHAEFMGLLAGSLFTLRKDDDLATWVADENNETIDRFGFKRSDFKNVVAPALPEYVAPVIQAEPAQSPAEIIEALQVRLAALEAKA
jgi:hypothetical protein